MTLQRRSFWWRVANASHGFCRKLGQEDVVSLLENIAMLGELVIGGEPSWMSGLCDATCICRFLEGVNPVSLLVHGVHEMHGCFYPWGDVGVEEKSPATGPVFRVHLIACLQFASNRHRTLRLPSASPNCLVPVICTTCVRLLKFTSDFYRRTQEN